MPDKMQKEKSKRQLADSSECVRCPFCHSTETRREANFGTTLGYAQFYCCACRTPFEWIKWDDNAPPADLPAFILTGKNSATPR
jgi:hypothetical protein